jgi:hypothetical protein
MGDGGSGRKGEGRTQDARRRTQGKPEGEIGGVGEREKEGRKTHLSTVA